MATFLDIFWEYFSGKTLPAPALIGFTLGLAIAVTLTLLVSIFFIDMYGTPSFIIKIVGLTTTSADDQHIELELISGRDLDGLVSLQVYINGVPAEPVDPPGIYTPGVRLTYKIPPNIDNSKYAVSVVGVFKDGIIAELYNTTARKG
ncbi:hypothetical protein SDC9_35369 [bioreactor metagenome]|uniref:Archaeal Type IV pilin N-terminal domain-containing protein n=1 Tax=bioreactor metagenome TaxID=1076179 RepID=A0A644VDV7_9ZZZZ|nr:hypothetical protein [Methanocorpusculum sp.]